MLIERRKFILGAAALLCAPAIVKAESLMPVSSRALVPKIITPTWKEVRVIGRYVIHVEYDHAVDAASFRWVETKEHPTHAG